MSPRLLLLILFAGLTSVVVVFATRSFLAGAQQQTGTVAEARPQVEQTKILIAKQDLPVGTILSETHVELRDWPTTGVHSAYFKDADTKAIYEGHVVRAVMTAGEPITRTSLIKQGERGFLAAILEPGKRAVTVNLTAVSGIGGFLFPGDRVDVILTHSVDQDDGSNNTLSETILQNVRVLAVDQRSQTDAQEVALRRTATLEVTPRMAEKIALLERVGDLSLSLRGLQAQSNSLDQQPIDKNASYTFDADISRFISRPDQKRNNGEIVRVRRGSDVTDVALNEGDSK